MNERFSVTASSLGSYFGVGFNTPSDQLLMDLGVIEKTFTKEEEDRMELGNIMEDATLNAIEYLMSIKITNRNTKVVEAMNGMLRFKLDGEAVINGVPTVVESKYSNSSTKFTNSKAYLFQCQAYMMATGYDQALLCGMWEGQPIWRLIHRDDAVIADIVEMIKSVYAILNGMTPTDNFPWALAQKYSSIGREESTQPFDDTDWALVERLNELSEEIKVREAEKSALTEMLKDKYESVTSVGDDFKVSVSVQTREGTIDIDKLLAEHTDIDPTKYLKAPVSFKTVRVYKLKKKVA